MESDMHWGGGSGGLYFRIDISRGYTYTKQYQTVDSTGGSTSFGSYLTAYGANALDAVEIQYQQLSNISNCSKGENGYDGLSKSGIIEPDRRLSRTGYGFGAGGGCVCAGSLYFGNITVNYIDNSSTYTYYDSFNLTSEYIWGGSHGEVRVGIFDLNASDEIPCTIGAGGSNAIDIDALTLKCQAAVKSLSYFITSNCKVASAYINTLDTSKLSPVENSISPGKDGAIILQYLGG